MDDTQPRAGTSDITAVILAAGANTRLAGVMPGFMKPLMLVNGRPLVRHALDHAVWDWKAERVIFVAAPQNASLLAQVTGEPNCERREWVLQPSPDGIIDAISRALPLVTTEWTLILCADNTFSGNVTSLPRRTACFGARVLAAEDASRFTRAVTRPDHGTRVLARDEPNDLPRVEAGVMVWIGPLLLKTKELCSALRCMHAGSSIERLIMLATDEGRELQPIMMACEDLGVPEMTP